LEVIAVDTEKNILVLKGAVPGARNGLLMISTNDGAMEVMDLAPTAEQQVETAPVAEVAAAETVAQ
jgi:hypothetical protein